MIFSVILYLLRIYYLMFLVKTHYTAVARLIFTICSVACKIMHGKAGAP